MSYEDFRGMAVNLTADGTMSRNNNLAGQFLFDPTLVGRVLSNRPSFIKPERIRQLCDELPTGKDEVPWTWALGGREHRALIAWRSAEMLAQAPLDLSVDGEQSEMSVYIGPNEEEQRPISLSTSCNGGTEIGDELSQRVRELGSTPAVVSFQSYPLLRLALMIRECNDRGRGVRLLWAVVTACGAAYEPNSLSFTFEPNAVTANV